MRIRISIGDLELRTDGIDLTKRDIRSLMRQMVAYSAALATTAQSEEKESPPIGFAAHIERAPDIVEDLSEWFEEAP